MDATSVEAQRRGSNTFLRFTIAHERKLDDAHEHGFAADIDTDVAEVAGGHARHFDLEQRRGGAAQAEEPR